MSEEKKQRTDDESVELGTVLQLSPHSERTKEGTVEAPADGKGFISLDEVYETKGFEAFETLAQNCAELSNNRRLSASGYTVLKLDGCESFMPGFDRQNAIVGAESFLDTLKNGFVKIIEGICAFIIKVLDWVVTRVKVMLGFAKTERELELVRENTNTAHRLLGSVIKRISEGTGLEFNGNVLYNQLPPNITQGEMFNVVSAKNRSVMEQIKKLSDSKGVVEQAAKALMGAGQKARHATNLYKEALAVLRNAADKGSVSSEDLKRFQNVLAEEVVTVLNPEEMIRTTEKVMEELYNLDVKSIGLGHNLSKRVTEFRNVIGQSKPLVVNPDYAEAIMLVKDNLAKAMVAGAVHNYDPDDLKRLQDLISGKDAKVLDGIIKIAPNTSVLRMNYSTYANVISTYVQHADLLSSILTQVKKTLASLVKYTINVDRVLASYIAGDIKTIISVQRDVMGEEAAKELETSDGKNVATIVDYDKLFMKDSPGFAKAVQLWRAEGSKFYKKYNGAFRELNKALSAIGVGTI